MYRLRLWQRASACLGLLLAPLSAAATPKATTAEAVAIDTLVLAVVVDGRALDEPVVAHRNRDGLSIDATDLRGIGVDCGAAAGDVPLSSIRGLSFTLDEQHQNIDIRTGRPSRTALRSRDAAPADLTPNGWGAFLNYDVTGYASGETATASGAFDGVVFTPRGYAFAGAIASITGGGGGRLLRTDIGYTLADPGRLLRATIGDVITGASSVSRPVRMAGIRIGTDFAIRPDLVTFPLPIVSGTAAVPSSVDLIVNGDRQSAGSIPAGRFFVSDVPVQTGLNTIAVTVRDALGRSSVQTVTTYAARELLRAGLSAFSVEAGLIRTGYLTTNDRYRDVAASGTWRRGMNDALTLETHGEASAQVRSGSVGGALNLGWLGLASASIGISQNGRAGVGTQVAIGLQRIARPVSLAVRVVKNSAGWSDLAAHYGSVTPGRSIVANIGFDLARYGTLGVSVLDLGRGTSQFDWRGGRLSSATNTPASTLVNATYSVKLGQRIGLLANIGTDARRRRSTFVSLGAVVVFGPRTSGYAGASRSDGGTLASATVSRGAVEQGDWGYRVSAAAGTVDRAGAAIQHLGRAGLVEAAVEETDGRVAGQVSARGSIVHVGGHAFAAETMTDSFAVVDASGHPGVAIYRDNHKVGVTDDRGLLVVSNMAAYQSTKLSIDPTGIDPSLVLENADITVRPGQHVGIHVAFGLQVDRSVLLTLVDAKGVPVAVGAHARFGGTDIPIGFDGQAYLTPGDGGAMAVTLISGRTCTVHVPARAAIAGNRERLACRSS